MPRNIIRYTTRDDGNTVYEITDEEYKIIEELNNESLLSNSDVGFLDDRRVDEIGDMVLKL